MTREFRALTTLCADLRTLIHGLAADDWARPTRCEPWTVKELATHVSQALDVLLHAEIKPAADTDRVIDLVDYGKGWDGTAAAPRILAGAQQRAAELTEAELVSKLDDRFEHVAAQLADLKPDALIGGSGAAIPARDLISVYVIEIGVHTLDIKHAVGTTQCLDATAARLITRALDGLLGEEARSLTDWDDITYILSGTGRRALTANETASLGPLADRFPMIR